MTMDRRASPAADAGSCCTPGTQGLSAGSGWVDPLEQNHSNSSTISRILRLRIGRRWPGDGMPKWEVIFARTLTPHELGRRDSGPSCYPDGVSRHSSANGGVSLRQGDGVPPRERQPSAPAFRKRRVIPSWHTQIPFDMFRNAGAPRHVRIFTHPSQMHLQTRIDPVHPVILSKKIWVCSRRSL